MALLAARLFRLRKRHLSRLILSPTSSISEAYGAPLHWTARSDRPLPFLKDLLAEQYSGQDGRGWPGVVKSLGGWISD